MAELQGKKRKQPSSCPEGWLSAARVVQLELTCRQERYAQRCVGIETLNVSGMIRAGLQSKALADAGMSGLLNQIRYKAQWHGTRIVEADRWYPSSKTCSACGVVNKDLGREPRRSCPNCGVIHDRNQNAARNLRKLALLAVGEDVMLPDGEALAGGDSTAGETAPNEGRTKPRTAVYTQLRLAL